MANKTDYAKVVVDSDTEGAQREINRLEKEAEETKKALDSMKKSGKVDLSEYKKTEQQYKRQKREIGKLKKETYDYSKVVKDLNGSSYKELQRSQRSIISQMKKMTTHTKEDIAKKKQLKKQLDLVNKELGKQKKQIFGARRGWQGFRSMLPILGVSALAAGLGRAAQQMLKLATTMQTENRRANIVFGENMDEVNDKVAEFANRLGMTDRKAAALAATTGDMLVPIGFARDQASDMSVEALKLAGALDEWTSGQYGVQGSLEAINSAITGEMEQLKKFGIVIRQNEDEFTDLVDTLVRTRNVTESQAKAMATLQLIQEKSVDAQNSFNMEGNKLLRTQKKLKRGWQQLKENVIGWFEVSAAEKLRREGDQANRLAMQLTDTNVKEEERRKILTKLEQISPQIIQGLNSENIRLEDLQNNLRKYNEELSKRIMLANLEEEEEERLAKLSKATNRRNKDKIELTKMMMDANRDLALTEGTFGEKLRRVTKYLEEHAEGIRKASGGVLVDTRNKEARLLEKISLQYNNYIENQEKVSELQEDTSGLQDQQQILKKILGLTEDISEENDEIISDQDTFEKQNNTLENSYKQRTLALKKQLAEQKITQRQYNDEMYIEELTHLTAKKALYDQYGRETAEIEEKIAQKQIEFNQNVKNNVSAMREETGEDVKMLLRDIGQESAQIMGEVDQVLLEQQSRQRQEYENLKSDLDAKYQLYTSFAKSVGSAMEQAAAHGNNIMVAAGKQMLFIVLDQLKQFAELMIYKITIGSLATPQSIASAGAAGLAQAAILTTLVEGAVAAAKGAIRGNTVKQRASGKYDVIGQDDGQHYSAGYKDTLNTGLVKQPTLVGEEPEIVIDTQTTKSIRMNHPELLDAINEMRVPQRAEGNYTAMDNTATGNSRLEQTLHEANENNNRFAAIIQQMMDRGIPVRWGYNDSRNVNDQISKMNSIKEDIG